MQYLIERDIHRDGCDGFIYPLQKDDTCKWCSEERVKHWILRIVDTSWERWIELFVVREGGFVIKCWRFYLFEWKQLLLDYNRVDDLIH